MNVLYILAMFKRLYIIFTKILLIIDYHLHAVLTRYSYTFSLLKIFLFQTKHSHMYHIFGFYGEVLNVYIGLPSNKSHSKCFGFVTYYSPKDAARWEYESNNLTKNCYYGML